MKRIVTCLCFLVVTGACASDGGDASAAFGAAGSPGVTAEPSPSGSPTPTPEPTPVDPPAGEKLRFLAIGDFGDGSIEQQEVADRMCRLLQRRPFDLVVTVGDNVYDYGHPDRFQAAFFEPYDCLFDAGVRFRATLGNHDIGTDNGRPELDEPAFGFNGRRNYVFRRGGVRFVMADSNDLRWSWLRSALTPEEGDRWTVVAFHHPVFSSGEYGGTPGFRPGLPRMFRNNGVDLVLNGHEHDYEVTKELAGIRYVVTGGGGASIRTCGELIQQSEICAERFHFLEVVAGSDSIVVRAFPRHGSPFHSFSTRGRD